MLRRHGDERQRQSVTGAGRRGRRDPLDLDVGRERLSAEAQSQRPTLAHLNRPAGLQENTRYADIEHAHGERRLHARKFAINLSSGVLPAVNHRFSLNQEIEPSPKRRHRTIAIT